MFLSSTLAEMPFIPIPCRDLCRMACNVCLSLELNCEGELGGKRRHGKLTDAAGSPGGISPSDRGFGTIMRLSLPRR